MRIRRLELQGFKSFKDKTVINFDDGITGIVGPNGCGKSNVVDAFFWVMGEQNARHLRGQSMDDLIFSGADKAPPASYAEVTLLLEMPGDISGPNAPAGASATSTESFATLPTREVAITRKLYRTGESDYFINKTPCRLRDIQELFMDTGVGARGYSIIQQGQIAKIVQAKPEDRRTMIEEVAGIVKYKARRRESMRKLEGTQQNLLRVTDVINELENQKRSMERQADKARKSKEWKERLQAIELNFNALKFEDLSNKVAGLEQNIEDLNAQDLALTAARETAETQIAQKRLEVAQASKVTEEFQQKWMEAGTTLNNVENELKYSQKNLDDLRLSFAQLEKDSAEERALVENLTTQHEELLLERATMEEQFVAADLYRKEQEEIASSKKRESEEIEKSTEETKRRLYQLGSEMEKARSTVNFSQQRLQELSVQIERIASERAENESFVQEARAEKENASFELNSLRQELDAAREQAQNIGEQLAQKNRDLDTERRELARLNSEQARLRTTLKTLENQKLRHEDSSKGVKAVFQDILPNLGEMRGSVHGTLADSLQVEKGFESAVEASLGRALDLVITSDAKIHTALSHALKEKNSGRASFADANKLQALIGAEASTPFEAPAEFASSVIGPISQFVSLQSENTGASALLRYLLDKVIVVQSAEIASQLSALFVAHSFITKDGEIFRGGWFMEGGDKSSISGAHVSRNREIAELTEKEFELTGALELGQAKLAELESSIQALVAEKRLLEDSLHSKQHAVSESASKEASLQARLQESEKSLLKFSQEEERVTAEQTRLQSAENEAAQKLESLETEKLEKEDEVSRLNESLAAARAALETAQDALMHARVKAANLADQKNSIETRVRQSDNSLSQHRNRAESMLEQSRRRQSEAEETSVRILELQGQIDGLREALVEAEQNYRTARDRLDILNNEVEEQRTAAQEHNSRERAIKDALMGLRLEHQKYTGERDTMAQNTFERYGLVLVEYCMMPETMEQVQLLRDAGENTITEIQNEVTLLREKIRKLGDVNPAAIEEYDAIVERYNLLSTQKADLEKAMNDLQVTVDRINKVSKERFERAFHEVNEHFKRVFPVIFGGGHAHLTLTNPEDMLETGVDITAQPPGKKAQNINLLSGGEKTLTAISLLFSIFLVKPSPFCLLDEVDAPLDDANIGRFNALLREMSKRSQFIIITHNKRTMELNDKLYGVTMEDAGVSKMVSILLSASA